MLESPEAIIAIKFDKQIPASTVKIKMISFPTVQLSSCIYLGKIHFSNLITIKTAKDEISPNITESMSLLIKSISANSKGANTRITKKANVPGITTLSLLKINGCGLVKMMPFNGIIFDG